MFGRDDEDDSDEEQDEDADEDDEDEAFPPLPSDEEMSVEEDDLSEGSADGWDTVEQFKDDLFGEDEGEDVSTEGVWLNLSFCSILSPDLLLL